jgi:hypothetical protein
MFITLFASMMLSTEEDFYNPVLKDQDENFSYKAPLSEEPEVRFEKCPTTRSSLIVISKNQAGDLIAVREPISKIEIPLEKSDKRSGEHSQKDRKIRP